MLATPWLFLLHNRSKVKVFPHSVKNNCVMEPSPPEASEARWRLRLCLSGIAFTHVHPSIFCCLSAGHADSVQTSLSPETFSNSSRGILRHSQASHPLHVLRRFPGGRPTWGILIRCANHLKWLLWMWRSGSSTLPLHFYILYVFASLFETQAMLNVGSRLCNIVLCIWRNNKLKHKRSPLKMLSKISK